MCLESRDFSEQDRVPALREFFGRGVMRVDFWDHANARGQFDFCTTITPLDEGTVYAHAEHTPTHLWRSPSLLQDGCDDVLLYTCSAGLVLRTPRDELVVPPGGIAVVSKAREYQGITPWGGPSTCLQVSHARLTRLLPHLEEAPLRVLPQSASGAALALAYARLLTESTTLPASQQDLAIAHVYELAASAIAAAERPNERAKHAATSATRLALIRRDMLARLDWPNLSLADIARRHHLTPRQVQRLFAREGTCFSDELRETRLGRAHALLTEPALRQRRILDIALDCGFTEISTFNRLFRRRFNATPSEIRPN